MQQAEKRDGQGIGVVIEECEEEVAFEVLRYELKCVFGAGRGNGGDDDDGPDSVVECSRSGDFEKAAEEVGRCEIGVFCAESVKERKEKELGLFVWELKQRVHAERNEGG